MKKQIGAIVGALSLLTGLGALARADVSVGKLAGTVEVQTAENGPWAKASAGQALPEGVSLRTGSDGEAELAYSDRSRVWIKSDSQVQVENARPLLNRLSFLFGSLKAAIPHLKRNQKFEIRTNTAVAAVRGTELTANVTKEGVLTLQCLYGTLHVSYGEAHARAEGMAGEYTVPQGTWFEGAGAGQKPEIKLLTPDQENAALEKWDPGLSKQERQETIEMKKDARAEAQQDAAAVTDQQKEIQSAVAVVKQDDLEAGRTLQDINGNQVRVDQRMFRPAGNQIQIVNMVKRTNYNYNPGSDTPFGGSAHLTHYVANQARLDSMQILVTFDQDLPGQLSDWPSAFDSGKVKIGTSANSVKVIMANMTDPKDIFAIAYAGQRDSTSDNINTGLFLGAPSCTLASDCLAKLADIANNYDQVYSAGQHVGGSNSDTLRAFDASAFTTGANGAGTKLWFVSESAVINNSGQVQSGGSLFNSNTDVFSLLENTAGEVNMMVKQDNSGAVNPGFGQVSSSDYIGGSTTHFGDNGSARNIDLVLTPDIMLAALTTLGPSFANAGAK